MEYSCQSDYLETKVVVVVLVVVVLVHKECVFLVVRRNSST